VEVDVRQVFLEHFLCFFFLFTFWFNGSWTLKLGLMN
jgi:hypothetical protein